MTNTFWLPNRVRDAKPIPETSDVFYNLFAEKMTKNDLSIIRNYWSAKQAEYVAKIESYEGLYVNALDCQKRTIDSLLEKYLTPLQARIADLDSVVTDEQIAELSNYYEKRLPSYESKKREFIEYEQRFTLPITDAMLNYMKYGFELMDEVPVSYYLDLASPHKRKLKFIDQLSDNPYVELFRAFEIQLDTLLTPENECRGHAAIPFYHKGIRDKEYYTTLNALLFAKKNKWLREVTIPQATIKWPDFEQYRVKDTIDWQNRVDFDLAEDLGLNYLEGGESLGGVWFSGVGNEMKNIMLTECSFSGKDSCVSSFEGNHKFDKVNIAKMTDFQLFYVVETEEGSFSIVDGILFTKGMVLGVTYSSTAFDVEKMKRELSILK